MLRLFILLSMVVCSLGLGFDEKEKEKEKRDDPRYQPSYVTEEKDLDAFYEKNKVEIEYLEAVSKKKRLAHADFGKMVFRIVRELKRTGAEKAVELGNGSGFFLSTDGYFASTHHGLDVCLEKIGLAKKTEHSTKLPCTDLKVDEGEENFFAEVKGKRYPVYIVSHVVDEELKKRALPTTKANTSIDFGTRKDFLIGKIDLDRPVRPLTFGSAKVGATKEKVAGVSEFFRPRRVFALGFPGPKLLVSTGTFIQALVTEDKGILAFFSIYDGFKPDDEAKKLEALPFSSLFLHVKAGMSGGPIVNLYGEVEGIAVAGADWSSTSLSRDNFLGTFFTKEEVEYPKVKIEIGRETWSLRRR